MWRSAVWLACAGCAQLFGINDTTGSGDAGNLASVAITRRSIGATVITAPLDLSMETATFYVPAADPNVLQTVAPTGSGGTWSADTSGTPIMTFTLPDYPMRQLYGVELGVRAVKFGYDVLEHPSPAPAPAGATIVAQATLPSAFEGTEGLVFYAIGAWSYYAITSGLPMLGTTAVNTSFQYDASTSTTGRPLERFTSVDRLLLLRYSGATLTGAGEVAMDQSDTTTTVVFGPVADVPPSTTGTVTIDPAGLGARYANTLPAMPPPSTNWLLLASVAPGEGAGVPLQSGSVAMTDTAISLAYSDPFTSPAWPAELYIASSSTRTFTPATPALPVTLSASASQIADPSSAADFAAGMPTSITVNGTVLNSDGMAVTVDPTRAVSVAFTSDAPQNTMYLIQLFKLVPSSDNMSLVYESQFEIGGTSPTFSVPAELFPDGLYTLRATCVAGAYPGAASGDLSALTLPIASGSLDSGVFTVTH